MRNVRMALRSRAALLIIVLAVFGSILGLFPPVDDVQSATCVFRPRITTYYSDASKTIEIGQRGLDCGCNEFSWGDTSTYMTHTFLCCNAFTC